MHYSVSFCRMNSVSVVFTLKVPKETGFTGFTVVTIVTGILVKAVVTVVTALTCIINNPTDISI